MQNYSQKKVTKYLQIFSCLKNVELTPLYSSKNKNDIYPLIEKFTIIFQCEDEPITLFGSKIMSAIMEFFPCVKIISFKNINFQSDSVKFRENFDDISDRFHLVMFGKKNEDFILFKNKNCFLKEIKFYNCYFSNNLLTKDVFDDLENNIYSYLGKKVIKITLTE